MCVCLLISGGTECVHSGVHPKLVTFLWKLPTKESRGLVIFILFNLMSSTFANVFCLCSPHYHQPTSQFIFLFSVVFSSCLLPFPSYICSLGSSILHLFTAWFNKENPQLPMSSKEKTSLVLNTHLKARHLPNITSFSPAIIWIPRPTVCRTQTRALLL